MKVQNERVVKQFIESNRAAASNLKRFLVIVRESEWNNHAEIRATFPSADYIGENKWIFNISGNNHRLAAMVWINSGVFHVLKVMTHTEYDKEKF
ncbi:MAG: type II toxin-antitoxin system HigB family toxin [Candidatus Obscuribacter sp.]|nr:type II toxin-antitoxin system HigB family toxin [Candidatus Obscuribacter sp.]MBK9276968.1 type II toxin-antitoxin system HigB family toxin [Candidatus Obscuribacter sp.]MBL8084601.1 type II toxin-antitoxin system HigB family toxin [Candidatus Obscuribacter sp.]